MWCPYYILLKERVFWIAFCRGLLWKLLPVFVVMTWTLELLDWPRSDFSPGRKFKRPTENVSDETRNKLWDTRDLLFSHNLKHILLDILDILIGIMQMAIYYLDWSPGSRWRWSAAPRGSCPRSCSFCPHSSRPKSWQPSGHRSPENTQSFMFMSVTSFELFRNLML